MGLTKEIQMLNCLGKHGSYSFYKGIKLADRVLTLASQFPCRIWPDSTILSLGEIHLIWTDKNESFCSLRLYFLPENTPDGRQPQHGEDEVIALQDTVIIRASDLVSWLVDEREWDWGYLTPSYTVTKAAPTPLAKAFSSQKFIKGDKDKEIEYTEIAASKVVVLNYERYIRLRTMLKRLEGVPNLDEWLTNPVVLALGGLPVGPNCRILFSKEVFDYPELEDHELLCNHMAPKLKGKQQKRRKRRRHASVGSESNASESSSNGSNGSARARRVNGVGKERNEAFKLDVADLARLYEQGILTSADFKDGSFRPTSAVMRRISEKLIAEARLSNNGRVRAENAARVNPITGNRAALMPSRRGGRGGLSLNQAHSMASDMNLNELAKKLERSNALQILPIRPSVIQKQEPFQDIQSRKRSKTEMYHSLNGDLTARLFTKSEVKFDPNKYSGPFTKNTLSVYGLPVVRASASRPEKCYNSELQTAGGIIVQKDNPKQGPKGSIKELEATRDLPKPIRFATPSPFAASSKIYGDPVASDRKKVSVSLMGVSDVSGTRPDNRGERSGVSRNDTHSSATQKSGITPKLEVNGEVDPTGAAYSGLTGIPPPNAMNQLGLRLTSEVTLFPSHLLPGIIGAGQTEPKDVKPSLLTHVPQTSSGRSSKGSIAEQRASATPPGRSVYTNDGRHEILTSPSVSGKHLNQSGGRSKSSKGDSGRSSLIKDISVTPAMSSANMPTNSLGHARDNQAGENHLFPFGMIPPNFMQQRSLQQPMFQNIDPNYMHHLFPQMFMPPAGIPGLPGFHGMLGMQPGLTLEQMQLYRELLQKGGIPQFPGSMLDGSKDKGQK